MEGFFFLAVLQQDADLESELEFEAEGRRHLLALEESDVHSGQRGREKVTVTGLREFS